jgi:hypothetical protein
MPAQGRGPDQLETLRGGSRCSRHLPTTLVAPSGGHGEGLWQRAVGVHQVGGQSGAEQLDDRAAAPRAPQTVRKRAPAGVPRDAQATARTVEVRRPRVGCRARRSLGRRRKPHRPTWPATVIGHFAGRTDDSAPYACVHVLTIQVNTPTPAECLEPVLHVRRGLRRSGADRTASLDGP